MIKAVITAKNGLGEDALGEVVSMVGIERGESITQNNPDRKGREICIMSTCVQKSSRINAL